METACYFLSAVWRRVDHAFSSFWVASEDCGMVIAAIVAENPGGYDDVTVLT